MQLVTAEDLKLAASCFVLAGVFLLFGAAFFSWVGYVAIRREERILAAWKKKREQAFSLLELLLVVSIALCLMAIAVPSFLASRQRANEASAVSSIKSLITSETSYNAQYGAYSPDLTSLGNTDLGPGCLASAVQACLIDSFLAAGSRSGYSFSYTPSTADYWIVASPIGTSGVNSFCAGSDGIIRANPAGACTVSSAAIQ